MIWSSGPFCRRRRRPSTADDGGIGRTSYGSCGIGSIESPTIIYEDNAACVVQMEIGYLKSNIIKHIAPKLFYPHELQKNGEIDILQTKSCDNLADLFIKSLPYFQNV